jgi:hypothetical protein
MFVGYPVSQTAVAKAKGINIPHVFQERFSEGKEVCIEIGGYREITMRLANLDDYDKLLREIARPEIKTKQRKKKAASQIRVPFNERVWDWLGIDRYMAGQEITLIFTDCGDHLAIMMKRY